MDKKEQQLFGYYYKKFSERRFDEKDVYGFFALVKNHSDDNKAILALSHFIVHREKSTGYVKEYLDECKDIINNLGQGKNLKKIEDIFSFKDIRNGFNALFMKHGYERLRVEIINDIILCIISLLQGIKLVSGNLNREVGHLSFAASSKEVFLMGNMRTLSKGRFIPVTFQILSVNNIYEEITPQDENDTPYLFNEEIMEVINVNEELVITFPEI